MGRVRAREARAVRLRPHHCARPRGTWCALTPDRRDEMSDEQRQARRRADGCAIGAEALTPLLLVLKDARNDAARKLVGPVRVEFDALAILREAAEQWPGHWFTVCVALAADPAVTDSGGDPETDVEAFAPWVSPWAVVDWIGRTLDGIRKARYVLDHLSDVADSEARRPDAQTPSVAE